MPVLLVGWSLGVLDTLAYVRQHGDQYVAGLVLVDNSVGEEPPPRPRPPHRPGPVLPHAIAMHRFVQSMFRRPQSASYIDRLTEATLHTPELRSRALLAYPEPRTYWRDAVYAHRQAGALHRSPRLAGGAGGEPGPQPPRYADRGVP